MEQLDCLPKTFNLSINDFTFTVFFKKNKINCYENKFFNCR